jgi:signal transduction histidine kinase
MCAGAVTVNASHWPSLLAFVLPSSLPLALSLFFQGPAWQVSGAMIAIFALSMSFLGVCAHRSFGDDVRVRLALKTEQRKLREANELMQIEVAQRRTVEATLHQAQKMEAIGHLTGGIAHDFNNLLQVMIGNLNLIKNRSGGNEQVIGFAETAEKAAMRGAELTTGLLTFARRQVLEARRVNLNDLLTEFEPILFRAVGAAVQCRFELAPGLPDCYADPAHFQSAVLNLVINARDAMPQGGRLLVATRRTKLGPAELTGNPDAVPGEFVGVSVRDTGVGMTDEVLAQVFEPFFTTKEVGKGSGLGLSQIYGFARQSGGHVQLISKPDEGTEAMLWLPVAGNHTAGESATHRTQDDTTT